LKTGSVKNTFFYFFDVNADSYMNYGEPVIQAVFSKDYISAITISRYVPDTTKFYKAGKGNDMVSTNSASPKFLGVDKFPLPGRLIKLFTSDSIPSKHKLNSNEIFSAVITENGHGVEMAIPWKYLKNWITPGEFVPHRNRVFTYKISLQKGIGKYNHDKIADNMGDCCNSVIISGNEVKLNGSVSVTELTPGSSYRFKIYYTNPTSAAEDVSIDRIYMSNLHLNADGPVLQNDFKAKIHADKNCSGTIDKGEDLFSYAGGNGILEDGGTVALTPDIQDQTSTAPALRNIMLYRRYIYS